MADQGFRDASVAGHLKDITALALTMERTMLEGITERSREARKKVHPYWSKALEIPDFTPVKALQLIGTELFRNNLHPDFWVLCLEHQLVNGILGEKVAITDIRFPNEAEMVRRHGGIIIRLERGSGPEWYQDIINPARDNPEWYERAIQNEEDVQELKKEFPDMPHESEWRSIGCEDVRIANNGSTHELKIACKNALRFGCNVTP